MRIKPVNLYTQTNIPISNKRMVTPYHTSLAADTVSFGNSGYQKALKEAVNTTFLRDIDVERAINKIFKSLNDDTTITKLKSFDFISDTYQKKGLRGLLRELWTPNPQPETKAFLHSISNEVAPLVNKTNDSIIDIYNYGPQGFWDCIRQKENSKRTVELIFSSADKDGLGLTVKLNNKGGLAVSQYRKDKMVFTEYHPSTGNHACEIVNPKYTPPYTTYYNKNGTKAFFKNLFYGGTPPVEIKW